MKKILLATVAATTFASGAMATEAVDMAVDAIAEAMAAASLDGTGAMSQETHDDIAALIGLIDNHGAVGNIDFAGVEKNADGTVSLGDVTVDFIDNSALFSGAVTSLVGSINSDVYGNGKDKSDWTIAPDATGNYVVANGGGLIDSRLQDFAAKANEVLDEAKETNWTSGNIADFNSDVAALEGAAGDINTAVGKVDGTLGEPYALGTVDADGNGAGGAGAYTVRSSIDADVMVRYEDGSMDTVRAAEASTFDYSSIVDQYLAN